MRRKRLPGIKILSIFMVLAAMLAACGNGSDNKTNETVQETEWTSQKSEGTAPDTSEDPKEAGSGGETVTLNIAYQYGLAYAPLIIMQEQGLIENAYLEATGNTAEIVWNQMSAGADINTGIASGNIQVGFMGVAPAVTGVMNHVGYKIFTNLSGQEHGLMTNDPDIQSFDDLIGSNHQIALVNIGSIQHIILARALDYAGYDAHALDANLVAMKHPDGMTSLETGAVACHLTTNPYIYKEREEEDLYEIEGISNVWSVESSFIVGVASTELYDENQELYQALCGAVAEAIDFINQNPEDAADITYEFDGNSVEDELEYLQKGSYSVTTKGILECAQFMADAQFIDASPETFSDLAFDNVQGD